MSQRLHQHLLLVTDRRHCRASDVFGGMGVYGHLQRRITITIQKAIQCNLRVVRKEW